MAIRPLRDLALIEVLPRRDEITDWRVAPDGTFVDLSENPLPAGQLAVVRQWVGTDNPSTLRYSGERTSPRLRRARVLAVGPRVTDIHPGDVVVIGVFAGLETDLGDSKDTRWIREAEVQLIEESA